MNQANPDPFGDFGCTARELADHLASVVRPVGYSVADLNLPDLRAAMREWSMGTVMGDQENGD